MHACNRWFHAPAAEVKSHETDRFERERQTLVPGFVKRNTSCEALI